MYDLILKENEKVKLISDNTIIYTNSDNKLYTTIITNQRLLFLDYPSQMYNSSEDLRLSGKINYIRKKEIIEAIELEDIISIEKETYNYRINIKNNKYLYIKDDEIINYLQK